MHPATEELDNVLELMDTSASAPATATSATGGWGVPQPAAASSTAGGLWGGSTAPLKSPSPRHTRPDSPPPAPRPSHQSNGQPEDMGVPSRRIFVGNLSYRCRWQDLKDLFNNMSPDLPASVVSADIIERDGRSKGCGTVEFKTIEDAQKAIDAMHKTEFQGRTIFLKFDRFDESSGPPRRRSPPPDRPRYRDDSRDRRGGRRYDDSPPPPRRRYDDSPPPRRRYDDSPRRSSRRDDSPPPPRRSRYEDDSRGGGSGARLFVGNLPWKVRWQGLKDLFKTAGSVIKADVMENEEGRSRGFGTVLMADERDAQKAIEMFHQYDMDGRQLEVRLDHR